MHALMDYLAYLIRECVWADALDERWWSAAVEPEE
jgi:hypothetical protein